ncbi:MAG TPA: hypothetical protein VFZ65_07905 [Planctomycetota bacterium]|nr:hypothetical protein [Planctomycetota bacterium]
MSSLLPGDTELWGATTTPALAGTWLFAQGLSLDPGVNAAGLTTSNAIGSLVGH